MTLDDSPILSPNTFQYYMEEESLNDLLNTLEASLTNLLKRVRDDPWSLLIFQTLIWSFRRWAVHQLMSTEINSTLHDYLWSNHINLVQEFAPDGLKEFATVWLNPSNIGDRIDILEELNAYFLFIVDKLDAAIENNDDDEQNTLSIFLDEKITEVLEVWLEGRKEFMIYPGPSDSTDSFSTERIFTIMQLILEKHLKNKMTELPVVAAETHPEPVFIPPPEPVENVPKETIASAIRKRTLRIKRQRTDKFTRKTK